MYRLKDKFKEFRILLASNSPRRKTLFGELGLPFKIVAIEGVDETYPGDLNEEEIPVYLAKKKAGSLKDIVDEKTLLITADTIVALGHEVLEKPSGKQEAVEMLRKLSGGRHRVITGVCLYSRDKEKTFHSVTEVFFSSLSDEDIIYYVENYRPFDKAGAYGIQEWIGYIGVERIEGSYFNVMGLPVHELYCSLTEY